MKESITHISRLIREKQVTSKQLVKACLEKIQRLNPPLNAFITILDTALENAGKADEEIKNGKYRGPLHGIPVAVKDFYDTAGTRTTAAFEHFKERVPAKDADIVARLKEAGAIIIGKTNMDRLGMGTTGLTGDFGPVHNPWNTAYITGGSSAGSAAAVATGFCYATVDTDAIGSCRLPAAYCNLTGFKGSYGLISMRGILEGQQTDEAILYLSQTGITTRTIEDTVILLNVLSDGDFFIDDNIQPKIGIVKNCKATGPVRKAFTAAADIIRSLGYACTEVDVPFAAASFNIKNIEADREKINTSLFRQVDVLLLPTTTDLAPTIDQALQGGPQAVKPDNTFFCNYYGLPAVSIPCGFDAHGLPLGLQIAGAAGGEVNVLQVAHAFQQATDWHLKNP